MEMLRLPYPAQRGDMKYGLCIPNKIQKKRGFRTFTNGSRLQYSAGTALVVLKDNEIGSARMEIWYGPSSFCVPSRVSDHIRGRFVGGEVRGTVKFIEPLQIHVRH